MKQSFVLIVQMANAEPDRSHLAFDVRARKNECPSVLSGSTVRVGVKRVSQNSSARSQVGSEDFQDPEHILQGVS